VRLATRPPLLPPVGWRRHYTCNGGINGNTSNNSVTAVNSISGNVGNDGKHTITVNDVNNIITVKAVLGIE
jgi:hypothetical protein